MNDINLFSFEKDSNFIIDLREKNFNKLYEKIEDISDLKKNEKEISIFNQIIDDYEIDQNNIDEVEGLEILPEYKEAFLKFKPNIYILNGKLKSISDIISSFKKRENITLKRICKKYQRKTGNKISKTSIFYLLKNKLKYKYLKTMPKTNKLKETSSIIRAFVFIKVIARALLLKMKIIYLDESNFQLENNNLRIWRRPNESPYFRAIKRGRKNIILALTNEEILLYKINNGTNRSSDFYEFMQNLIEKINKEDLSNYLIVMDNCSIHLTKKLKDFYSLNKLKILTIVPYFSQLNSVEVFFNYLKQKLYKKVFRNFTKLISFIENSLNDEEIGEILNKIFIKTIKLYKEYIINNRDTNLNN